MFRIFFGYLVCLNVLTCFSTFVADIACASSSSVSGEVVSLGTAGEASTFTIRSFDSYGNKKSSNDDQFFARFVSAEAPFGSAAAERFEIEASGNGEYEADGTPTVSGVRSLAVDLVTGEKSKKDLSFILFFFIVQFFLLLFFILTKSSCKIFANAFIRF